MKCTLIKAFISELLVAIGGGAVAAIFIIPVGITQRGEFAVGGEWLGIALAACITYRFYHAWLFKILDEGGNADKHNTQRKEVNRRVEEIRKYTEQEVGVLSDEEFITALPYARRKLQDINHRFGTTHGDRYLSLLVAETVSANRLSRCCDAIRSQRQRERKPTLSGNSINSHAFTIPQTNQIVKM